eukprot:5838261-Amphidinium_carterae.1
MFSRKGFGVPERRSGVARVGFPDSRVNSALTLKELHALILDDETWLSDVQPSGANTKGVTLCNAQ